MTILPQSGSGKTDQNLSHCAYILRWELRKWEKYTEIKVNAYFKNYVGVCLHAFELFVELNCFFYDVEYVKMYLNHQEFLGINLTRGERL